MQINKQPNQSLKRNDPEYYLLNKEHIRQQQKEYKLANKDKIKEILRLWRLANRVHINAKQNERLLKKPSEVRAAKAAYKRRVRNQMPPWADRKAIKEVYMEANQRGLTVDHIVPLKGDLVSGLHVEYNLQLLTRFENSQKGNQY